MLEEIHKKLEEEVGALEHELRVILPREIKKALEHGDLRENSEYKSALERQEFVKIRLGQVRQRMTDIGRLDVSSLPEDEIAYGSVVEVKGRDNGDATTFRLVMPEETDPDRGWISVSSPIGRGLMGRAEGDEIEIRTPGGVRRWIITNVRTIHDQKP